MSNQDHYECLKATLISDFHAGRQHKKPADNPLVITLSRDYGAQGEIIAEKLHECLGLPIYQDEILSRVAQKAKVDKFLFERHDELVAGGVSSFIYSLIHGAPADMQTYRRALYAVVLDLASKDGVIIGRGGHLILSGKKVFRLRIVGSRKQCAERVAAELNISYGEAEQKVAEVNRMRHASMGVLFKDRFPEYSLNHAANFDLIINTDHITPEGAALIILMAMRQAGFEPVEPGRL